MKKYTFIALLILAGLSAHAQEKPKPFVINGHLSEVKNGTVYLRYLVSAKSILDSAGLVNGNFALKGMVSYPQQVSMVLKKTDDKIINGHVSYTQELRTIYLEGGITFNITGNKDLTSALVKGGPAQNDYEIFRSKIHGLPAYSQMMKYADSNRIYFNTDTAKARLNAIRANKESAIVSRAMQNYYRTNPDSYATLFAVSKMDPSDPAADTMYRGLSERMRNTVIGLETKAGIALVNRLVPGKMAIDFVQADTSGKMVSLASFRGKYVLIDFWASWCGPCRKENPNVVKAFDTYKDKGFTVLGVSLDNKTQRLAWLNAIKKDGLNWTHVSDLEGWNNAVAKIYGVQAIPQNFLIGPDGTILGKNLRGEDLEKALLGIFKTGL